MTVEHINVGAAPNDGTGDPIRTAFQKVNSNLHSLESRSPLVAPVSGYQLVKDWDFKYVVTDELALLSEFHTRYIFNDGSLDVLPGEWERYRNYGNHIFTSEGLSLIAKMATQSLGDGNIFSGMLRSRWAGKFGWFEAKIRAVRGAGAFPAFWLYPFDGQGILEIDIVEIPVGGNENTKRSYHFVHQTGNSYYNVYTILTEWDAYVPGWDFADDFHVFAIDWDANNVKYYVDGLLVKHVHYEWKYTLPDGRPGPDVAVFLNLAVGGGWAGNPQLVSDFPMAFTCEYIRVWQPPSAISAYGIELVDNGTFYTTTTGWSAGNSATLGRTGTLNSLTVAYGGVANPDARFKAVETVIGANYRAQALVDTANGTCKLFVGTAAGGNQYNCTQQTASNATTLTFTFTATSTTTFITLSHTGTGTAVWDDVSLKKQIT